MPIYLSNRADLTALAASRACSQFRSSSEAAWVTTTFSSGQLLAAQAVKSAVKTQESSLCLAWWRSIPHVSALVSAH